MYERISFFFRSLSGDGRPRYYRVRNPRIYLLSNVILYTFTVVDGRTDETSSRRHVPYIIIQSATAVVVPSPPPPHPVTCHETLVFSARAHTRRNFHVVTVYFSKKNPTTTYSRRIRAPLSLPPFHRARTYILYTLADSVAKTARRLSSPLLFEQ